MIGSPNAPSQVEFHRCSVDNNTAGEGFQDDPQGEGGAFALGGGTTIVISECLVVNNYAGDRVRRCVEEENAVCCM